MNDAWQRMSHLAEKYREAFTEVQRLAEKADLGRTPPWVFAIEKRNLDELAAISVDLAQAEQRRRAWRTALQSLGELIALGEDGVRTGSEADLLASDEAPEQLRRLDRFISVMNNAKLGGCIYVNGVFEPVERHGVDFSPFAESATPAPARRQGPSGNPAGGTGAA